MGGAPPTHGHAERMQLLYEASRAFAEDVGDPERLLHTIARACSRLVGDFTAVSLVSDDDEWVQHACVYHADPELERGFRAVAMSGRSRVGEGITGKVIANDERLLLAVVDPETIVAHAPDEYKEIARRLDVRSYLGVAMHARGRVIGAIALVKSHGGAPYTKDDAAFLQDLADRAALALENARMRAGFERRVADATAQVAAANKELDALSYSVTHDLRAPLRSIDGLSLALQEGYDDKLDDQGRAYLRRVRQSAERMTGLIDDLLALARVTRAELCRRPVDLSEMARASVARLRLSDPDRQVEVTIAGGLEAYGDRQLLGVVLDHLLGNAWKYSSKKARAHVELGARRDGERTVYFVRDDGAGFDMKHAKRLFGVFQRLHSDDDFEGTGIGLATVERIIHRHGGEVWAEAEPGRGATFSFSLGR